MSTSVSQLLAVQSAPKPHALPHIPQFSGSVWSCASHPLIGTLSQSPQLTLQPVASHVPPGVQVHMVTCPASGFSPAHWLAAGGSSTVMSQSSSSPLQSSTAPGRICGLLSRQSPVYSTYPIGG